MSEGIPQKESESPERIGNSNENLEAQETETSHEIADEINGINDQVEKINVLIEDPNTPASLKERLLETVDRVHKDVSRRLQVLHVATPALVSAAFAFHQLMINNGSSVIEDGSVLGRLNNGMIAGAAVWGVTGLFSLAHSRWEKWSVKSGVKEGNLRGGLNAAMYIAQNRPSVDGDSVVDTEGAITHNEHMALFDESLDTHARARGSGDFKEDWKKGREALKGASMLLAR